MKFVKLTQNSKILLDALIQSANPTQFLYDRLKNASNLEHDELKGIIMELQHEGYVDVKWASNMPYFVTINNSARTYEEHLKEYELRFGTMGNNDGLEKYMIFISHRSTDKAIADMLVSFFTGTGIPSERVFCSSLPGNDINEQISKEVREALKKSAISIAILSPEYYQSAYCLNEAGILWYRDDVLTIPIALPGITPDNMYGFLNSEYKLRKLDCDTDIAYIYDMVREIENVSSAKHTVITAESQKLKDMYGQYVTRTKEAPTTPFHLSPSIIELTTDDERVVLYYILLKSIRKVEKDALLTWLRDSEIHGINVSNAFDLISAAGCGTVNGDDLELGIELFREYTGNSEELLHELQPYVDKHTMYASNSFRQLWESQKFSHEEKLFVAYIVDEKVSTFGARWKAEGEIDQIKQWESKYSLNSILSNNYGAVLETFINYRFVYESDWTKYNNTREYTLYNSLKKMLFTSPEPFADELQRCKSSEYFELPF